MSNTEKVEVPRHYTVGSCKCMESGCTSSFKLKIELIHHLEKEHDIQNNYTEQLFDSYDDFKDWLRNYEYDNDSQYVVRNKKTKNGKSTYYYECSRSGDYRIAGGTMCQRVLKKRQNSIKIGALCTSHIVVKEAHNGVLVRFWQSHYNHTKDLKYLRISKARRREIAEKLSMGLNSRAILTTTRSKIGEDIKRDHILSRSDINNIRKSFNIEPPKKECHTDDGANIDVYSEQYKEEFDEDSYIFSCEYYEEGEDGAVELETSNCYLILGSDGQRTVLKKFDNDTVCLGGTYKVNQCNIEAAEIIHVDELTQGEGCNTQEEGESEEICEVVIDGFEDTLENCNATEILHNEEIVLETSEKDTLMEQVEKEVALIIKYCRETDVDRIQHILQRIKNTRVFVESLNTSDNSFNLEKSDQIPQARSQELKEFKQRLPVVEHSFASKENNVKKIKISIENNQNVDEPVMLLIQSCAHENEG